MSGLGAMLRDWRVRALLSQEQLAERAGLSVRTIRGLEAGAARRPRTASLRLLADALELTEDERTAFVAAAGSTHPPAAGHDRSPSVAVPRQLPADVTDLVGREDEVAELLDAGDANTGAGAVAISAVDGMPGVGKTALAVRAAHRLADRYPDGQIYLDLHGFSEDTPVEPGEALDRLLRVLGVPGERIPADVEERAALYRSRLADRRVLIVLDNASGEDQVAPLLPGSPGNRVLITSRRRLLGIDHSVSLDVLPRPDAVRLFTDTAGADRLRSAPPAALAEVVELCGRLPLAIRIAGARLRSRPAWDLAHLAERLADHRERLTELVAGQRGVTAALDLSYQQLTADQRRTYRLLGLHPGPDLEVHAAAALLGVSLRDARRLLDQLLDVHLLVEPASGRYRFHDLVRDHASRLAGGDTERGAALGRLYAHYAHAASMAMDAAYPYERERRPTVPPAGSPSPAMTDRSAATGWLDAELSNLLATAQSAPTTGHLDHPPRLAATLHGHLAARGRHHDAETLHRWGIAAAADAGDRTGERAVRIGRAHVHRRTGRYDEAADDYERALDLARADGHGPGEVDALVGLGQVRRIRGRLDEAVRLFDESGALARAAGYHTGELEALLGLAMVQVQHRRIPYEQAVAKLESALAMARELGHVTGEQQALVGLGWVHLDEGRHERAVAAFEAALAVADAERSPVSGLISLLGLGAVHRAQGRYAAAIGRYRQILGVAAEIGDRNMRFEALQGMGRTALAAGEPDTAVGHHREALRVAGELGQPSDVARAHDGLAHAYRALGDLGAAREHWQRALDLLVELGIERTEDPEAHASLMREHLAGLEADTRAGPGGPPRHERAPEGA